MSPLKKPKLLGEICQEAVKNILVDTLLEIHEQFENEYEDETKLYERQIQEEKALNPVKEHFRGWLTPVLASKILQLILRDDLLHPDTRIQAFQTLFTQHSRTMSFVGSYHEHYHKQITTHLNQIADISPKVEDLSTRGVWLQSAAKEGYRDHFYDALRKFDRLKSLTVPYVADDQLLRIVAANCPQLTLLDVSGAMELTDAGVQKWVKNLDQTAKRIRRSSMLSSLKYLNLGGPGGKLLQPQTVAEVLYAFQNLISLGSYPFMGQVLDHLQYEIDGYYQTRLRYFHDRKTNMDTVDLIAYCCPDLFHLFLDTPDPGITKAIFKNHGDKLRKLKVSKVNCRELNEIFEAGPKGLVSLELVNGRDSLDLHQVAKSCYHLQTLEIYYSMAVHVSQPQELHFPSLTRLCVYSTDVRGNYTPAILKSCPRMERLTLNNCDGLTDDDLFEVLETNPLTRCRDLCLILAPQLTIRSVWTVMTCCDSITFLGKLDTWNVNYAEVEDVRDDIRMANMDLELWETFDSFDRQDAMENFIRVNRGRDQGMEQLEQ